MKTEDPLLRAARATQRYWNQDGLPEIYSGLLMLLVPVFLAGLGSVAKSSVWHTALVVAFPVFFIGAFVISRRVLNAVKSRVTYPREGTAIFRDLGGKVHLAGAVLAASLVALFLVLRAWTAEWVSWLYLLLGVIPGVFFIVEARLLGVARFYVPALLSVALGVILGLAPPEDLRHGMSVYFGCLGAAEVISGGLVLWKFTRLRPTADQEAQ